MQKGYNEYNNFMAIVANYHKLGRTKRLCFLSLESKSQSFAEGSER